MVTGIEASKAWTEMLAVERPLSIGELFADDPTRVEKLTLSIGDLVIDLSKNLIDDRVVATLLAVADEADVESAIGRLLDGYVVNLTEGRAAGHGLLRRPEEARAMVDGVDVAHLVHGVLARMRSFVADVHSGRRLGATGERLTTIVNIGIGGSDLGPSMAYEALRPHHVTGLRCRFVSNIDPADLRAGLSDLEPASTLFVVASKTFATTETLANAKVARDWIVDALGEKAIASHFVAVSTNSQAVRNFGIGDDEMFPFWDWVGGRYSLPSSIGLSLMLGVGSDAFDQMRAGMHVIDEAVRSTPARANAAVMMALIGIWNRNVLGCVSKAVLPYSHDLRRFPAFLQQLDMESNGKSTRLDGSPVPYETGPIIWGEPGTNSQHAFIQSIHQGTSVVPVDFIGFAEPADALVRVGAPDDTRHRTLFLGMLAQARALAFGRSLDEVSAGPFAEHRVLPGNRPSTVVVARRLSPSVLGQLVALYEHVVHVQGVIWGINSFDQFGVELGKEMALDLAVTAPSDRGADPSTHSLLRWYHGFARGPDGG
ncbi:MAG: glucose-6-phosphate isomerase [Actinobacteria bacterium]|nr:glucose-6-phosphate isomerase [Actinomycetota bacterium]